MQPIRPRYVPGWLLAALFIAILMQSCGQSDKDSSPPPAASPTEEPAPLALTPKLRFLTTQGTYQITDLIPTDATQEALSWNVVSGPGRMESTALGIVLQTEGEGTLVLIGRDGNRSRAVLTFEVRSGPTLLSTKASIEKNGRSIVPVSPGEKVTLNVMGGVPDLKVCTSLWRAKNPLKPCVQEELLFEAGDQEGSVQVWIQDGANRESNRLEFQISKRSGALSYRFADQGQLLLPTPESTFLREKPLFTVSPDRKSLFIVTPSPASGTEMSELRVEKRDERGALAKAYGNGGVALVKGAFRFPARSVAVDSNGRLLLVVERRMASATLPTFALLRLSPEGILDKTFAQEGTWDLPEAWGFTDIALRTAAGNRIMLAYTITQESESGRSEFYTSITSLNEWGQPDSTFGNNGRTILKLNLGSQQSLVIDEERGLIHVTGFQELPQGSPLRPRKSSVAAYARLSLDTGAPQADFGREGLMTINVDYQACCDASDFQQQTGLFYTSTGYLGINLADKLVLVNLWTSTLAQLTITSSTPFYFKRSYMALQVDGRKLFSQASLDKANFFFRMPDGTDRKDVSPIEVIAYGNVVSPSLFKEGNAKVKVKRADGEIVPWWFELREGSKLLVLGNQLLVTLPDRVLAFELEQGSPGSIAWDF